MGDQTKFAILITRSHCLGGKRGDVFEGTVLKAPEDLSIKEARAKVAMEYAVKLPLDKPGAVEIAAPAVTDPGSLESRDPALEDRDPTPAPKPARKRKPGGKGTKARRGK